MVTRRHQLLWPLCCGNRDQCREEAVGSYDCSTYDIQHTLNKRTTSAGDVSSRHEFCCSEETDLHCLLQVATISSRFLLHTVFRSARTASLLVAAFAIWSTRFCWYRYPACAHKNIRIWKKHIYIYIFLSSAALWKVIFGGGLQTMFGDTTTSMKMCVMVLKKRHEKEPAATGLHRKEAWKTWWTSKAIGGLLKEIKCMKI